MTFKPPTNLKEFGIILVWPTYVFTAPPIFSAIRYHDADDIAKYQSIEMAKELIEVRSRNMYIDNMGIVDINEILDHICIS